MHNRDKSFDDFKLIIVDSPPKIDSEESYIISSSFGISRGNQSNKDIYRIILSRLLKRWEESKTQSHPRFFAMTPSEKKSLKI